MNIKTRVRLIYAVLKDFGEACMLSPLLAWQNFKSSVLNPKETFEIKLVTGDRIQRTVSLPKYIRWEYLTIVYNIDVSRSSAVGVVIFHNAILCVEQEGAMVAELKSHRLEGLWLTREEVMEDFSKLVTLTQKLEENP